MDKFKPAGFLLINSKGRPDFLMTMLVVVIVASLLVILFWMGLNLIVVFGHWTDAQHQQLTQHMINFNEQTQIIILGLFSSIFTLAGSYYLRRSSYDKHYLEREKFQHEVAKETQVAIAAPLAGFIENTQSTLLHPNYDDTGEDI